MKRFGAALLMMTCVVVSQKKMKQGYLTECYAAIDDDKVFFDESVLKGQTVTFSPFIVESDDYIHGKIVNVEEVPISEIIKQSSETGKHP